MVLGDTSAWVEYLRDTGSPVCIRVAELLGADLATCDVGARDEQHRRDLRRLIARAALVPISPATSTKRRCSIGSAAAGARP